MTGAGGGSGDIKFERRGGLGLITLNRPKALNALTLEMIGEMHPRLDAWAADPSVKAVAVQGAGDRAFCAGGDILHIYHGREDGRNPFGEAFFRAEYALNRRVKTYPKPYVALMDGVTMGGGVGLSVHGSHRVVSERCLFAMPETGIGLFPDVGGSYFLPRLPGQLGLFLGLTGWRLKAADCLYCGIGTAYLESARIEAFIEALRRRIGLRARRVGSSTAPWPACRTIPVLRSWPACARGSTAALRPTVSRRSSRS